MKNKIFIGNNLDWLNSNKMSEFIEKVGLVYIDPPYNNGAKLSYKNSLGTDEWALAMEQAIKASYKYMSQDAAIFVSIDDRELVSLKIILDKIFKKENFVGIFITRQAQRSNAKHINTIHEYVLCYAKNKQKLPEFKINRIDIPEEKLMIDTIISKVNEEFKNYGHDSAQHLLQDLIQYFCSLNNIKWLRNYNNIDEKGKIYFAKDLSTPGKPRSVNISSINLHLDPLLTRGWSSDRKFIKLYKEDRLVFRRNRPYEKHYLNEAQDSAPSILNFYSRQGTNALKKMGINKLFDTPKPVEMIKFFIRLGCKRNTYIMDFFAGSGTTAQAVYEVNKEDNTNHNYILIQLDEKINKKSPVFDECKKLGINPKMQYILKYRIDKYLQINNRTIDYDFYDA